MKLTKSKEIKLLKKYENIADSSSSHFQDFSKLYEKPFNKTETSESDNESSVSDNANKKDRKNEECLFKKRICNIEDVFGENTDNEEEEDWDIKLLLSKGHPRNRAKTDPKLLVLQF